MALSDAVVSNFDELNSKGYLLIKGGLDSLPKSEIETIRKGVETDCYKTVFEFVSTNVIPLIKSHLGFSSPVWGKTHMSDNNNPTTFHRDSFCVFENESDIPSSYKNMIDTKRQTLTLSKTLPTHLPCALTMVIYLDNTELSVIQGSHLITRAKITQLIPLYWNNYIRHDMSCGDIIIFYSHLVHKGQFYPFLQRHRRVIQCFELYPNKDLSDFEMNYVQFSGISAEDPNSEEEELKLEKYRNTRILILKIILALPIIEWILQFIFYFWMIFHLHEYQLLNLFRKKTNNNGKNSKTNTTKFAIWRQYGSFKYHDIEQFKK